MPAQAPPSGDLTPTLWRTCRALANRHRLEIIKLLIRFPNQPVSEVARSTTLSTPAASQYLRLLNARGLLRATRAGRHVLYRVAPNDSIEGMAELLGGIRNVFRRGRDPADTVFQLVTAFTHPRRVAIVKALGEGAMSFPELRRRTGISSRALRRHLAKLDDRGMVVRAGRGGSQRLSLADCRNPLGRVLLQLARQG